MFKLLLTSWLVIVLLVSTLASGDVTPDRTIKLTLNNTVSFRENVTKAAIDQAIYKLQSLATKRGSATYPIYVVIDTNGGDPDEAERLTAAMSELDNVYIIALQAYSAGAIMVELQPRTRLISTDGTIMFHQVKITITRPIGLKDLEELVKILNLEVGLLYSRIELRLGMSKEQFLAFMEPETFYGAQEAKDLNLVDEIVKLECSERLSKSRVWSPSAIQYSGCPLDRDPLE